MIGLIKPKKPDYVERNRWLSLTRKEQDYLYMVSLKNKPSKEDMQRMLYISSDWWLEKLRRRVMSKLYN